MLLVEIAIWNTMVGGMKNAVCENNPWKNVDERKDKNRENSTIARCIKISTADNRKILSKKNSNLHHYKDNIRTPATLQISTSEMKLLGKT